MNSMNSSIASTAVATVNPINTQSSTTAVTVKNESTSSAVKNADAGSKNGTSADNNQPSEDDFKNATDELNDFMQSMNTDIKFTLHTKTNTLMIQVEDGKTHQTLREFPAHDLLDMMARLKDNIGVLVDKRV